MGKTREHLEARRGVSSHIGDFIQSGGAGSDIILSGDVGAINVQGEALSGGTYGFLMTGDGEKAKRSSDRNWRQEGSESVLKAARTQAVRMYINRRQATVAQWVSLRTIL